VANDAVAGDYFGRGVSIDGSTIVVGAYCNDDDGREDNSGLAYVYAPTFAPPPSPSPSPTLTTSPIVAPTLVPTPAPTPPLVPRTSGETCYNALRFEVRALVLRDGAAHRSIGT
jgi:hypothetical protein